MYLKTISQVKEGGGDRILSDLNISIGSDTVFVGFLSIGIRSGFHRVPLNSDVVGAKEIYRFSITQTNLEDERRHK
jgi:hypothetical protein